jgi:tripartite-type tricarboxylate transporter receptor subunit TctC
VSGPTTKIFYILLLGLAVIATTDTPASATEYPANPVIYIIPFGDGGGSSFATRLQQPTYKRLISQDLIVVNKPGGGGAVVWSQMTRMPIDGVHHYWRQPAAHYSIATPKRQLSGGPLSGCPYFPLNT